MRDLRELPTQAYLREVLDYDPATGIFRWKLRPDRALRWNSRCAGKIAGCRRSDGYQIITIDDRRYFGHRIAWMYVHGECPPQIDHENHTPGDDRIANLRPATSTQNRRNRPKQRNNTSGFKGVFWYPYTSKWSARITINRKQTTLGYFATREEASAVYQAAAGKLFGEFAHVEAADK